MDIKLGCMLKLYCLVNIKGALRYQHLKYQEFNIDGSIVISEAIFRILDHSHCEIIRPEVIKLFSCSTQLNMKFLMLIT